MALARILVDGYSLLHSWPELAPGQPRHSAAARDELVHVLAGYRPRYEREPPKTAEEAVERAAASAV